MKTKKLVMGMVTMAASCISLQAADYVYTQSARYKVVGQNMLTSGSPEDNPDSWNTAANKSLSQLPDTFVIENEGGPDGGKYLKIQAGGIGASMVNADVMLEAGQTYFITYKVKSGSGRQNNSLSLTGNNSQNIFVNADGSFSLSATGYEAISKMNFYYDDEWTEMNYAYTVPADAPLFLVMNFANLLVGDGFADFGVYAVEQVADGRVLQRTLERSRLLLSMPELTEGRSSLESIVAEMEEFLGSNESVTDQNDYMAGLEQEMKDFLDKNGVDMSPYLSNFTFDNVTPKGNSNISGWNTGSRWGTSAANWAFPTTFAVQAIGNAYKLGRANIKQEKGLPAGKYLYVTAAMGYDYPNKTDIINYRAQVEGVKMFINNDSLEYTDLPTRAPKTYGKVFEVKEGETVTIGIENTGISNANQIWADNYYLYLLDNTKENVEAFVNAKKLADAQLALQVMVDSAKVVVEKPEYIFGKQALRDSISLSEAVYAAQTDPVASPAILTAQMNYIRAAINSYYAKNTEAVQLAATIADCKELILAERYTEGKSELQKAVDIAQSYYNGLDPEAYTEETADDIKTGISAANDALLVARNSFYVANASYNNPGLVAIVNPTFEQRPSSTGADVPGWDAGGYNQNSKSGWKGSGNGSYGLSSTGRAVVYGRNSSEVAPKYLAQDVKLEHPGVYEFSSEMVVFHATASRNNVNSGVFYFVGKEGLGGEKFDSVQVHVMYENDGSTIDLNAKRWKVRYVATDAVTVRFGVDAINNKAGNRIFFSANEVRYFGPYDKYQRDSVIAVAQPTIDSLAREISVAQDLKNTSRNKEKFPAAVSALESAIAKAEVLKNKGVSSLDELIAFNEEITALKNAEDDYRVSGVWPAEGECFDLSRYIRNAELADTLFNEASNEFVFSDWASEGNTAYVGEGNLLTYVFNKESKLDMMKVHQIVENMPAGRYQFIVNATYKLETDGTGFPQDADMNNLIEAYNAADNFEIVANSTTMPMKGVLTGCAEDAWSDIISSWNYRHHHPSGILDGPRFYNYLDFNLDADEGGKIDLGIQVKDAKATQLIWAKNFGLLFWGDEAPTGIKSVNTTASAYENDKFYDLQGRMVKNPQRGIYIVNGYKVVVR